MSLVFICIIKYIGDNMTDPIEVIDKIKKSLEEVIDENNLDYLNNSIDDIFMYYSSDLVSLLLKYYPGSTVMMHKFFKSCAVMINGNVYNSYGICDRHDYHVAMTEEINYIKKSFPNMSDIAMNSLLEKLNGIDIENKGNSYTLRKNNS